MVWLTADFGKNTNSTLVFSFHSKDFGTFIKNECRKNLLEHPEPAIVEAEIEFAILQNCYLWKIFNLEKKEEATMANYQLIKC